MERTLFDSVEGRWEIGLEESGEARLCTQGVHRSGGSVSHYASPDGKDHHNETELPWFSCMSGRWQSVPSSSTSVLLTLERVSHSDAKVEEGAFDAVPGTTALCWGLDHLRELPGPVLACRFRGDLHQSEQIALAIEGAPRDGSWTQREDITLRGDPTFAPDVAPWILASASGPERGLVIRSTDDGPGRGPTEQVELTLELGTLLPVRASEVRPQ
jgi:hypothetical protein